MNKILKRDEFITEVYNPMIEQKEYEELEAVNEGLLKTLFGIAKNLFKKDWETIKGDSGIIQVYKELDDKLTGFSLMKLSKKTECNQIRQALVDFACDWYDLKMNKAKEDDTDPKPAKSMKFKNDTLKENLSALENKIKDIANGDEQMLKWANSLKEEMKTVINRTIYNSVNNDDVKKEIDKQIEDDSKKIEEVNKQMAKWENDQLVEINKERETLISSFNSSPENGNTTGDKEVSKLTKPFLNTTKDDIIKYAETDNLLGLKKVFASANGKKEINMGDRSYNILDAFYNKLNKDIKNFKETPAQSVQAMCIAVNAFVKSCGMKTPKFEKNTIELMARCAIISNGVVGYNLPLNDKTGDEAGNYFTDTLVSIIGSTLKTKNNEDIKLPSNFTNNAKNLFDDVKKRAKQLMKEFNDKRDSDLKNIK